MTDAPATDASIPRELTPHDLYELCVQSPAHLVPFLRAVHGHDPRLLGEDFAGTAALSHLWADQGENHHAVAVDELPHIRAGVRHGDGQAERDGVSKKGVVLLFWSAELVFPIVPISQV